MKSRVWRLRASYLVPALLSVPSSVYSQHADSLPPAPREATYAQLGDLRMYYELYGRGQPLILLHGGFSTVAESFARQVGHFSRDRLLVAPEQQGHGHTHDRAGPLDYGAMAEATARLLERLKVREADVLGWSDGGIVGLLLAARHPELVHRLVITGASTRPLADAAGTKVAADVASWNPDADSEGKTRYARLFADSASHYSAFVGKLKEMWLAQPTDSQLGPAELAKISAPTLVIAGDRDVIRLDHTVELFRNLRNARLLIVPGTGHNTLGEGPEWLNGVIESFLKPTTSPP